MKDILFRGKNMNGDYVEGSLIITNMYIKHRPKQHTKHWIVTSSFGNGGWFNIIRREYVLEDSIQVKLNGDWINPDKLEEN